MILTWAGRTHSAASIDARLAALEHTQQGPPPSADDTDSEVE
jgi:hypothetical protein